MFFRNNRDLLLPSSSSSSSPPVAPLAYEPFSTLAMVYEDDGDVEKALQFGLIAAHLNPSDCEEWVKLADMSLDRDNVRQAIICYSKGKTGVKPPPAS